MKFGTFKVKRIAYKAEELRDILDKKVILVAFILESKIHSTLYYSVVK